MYVLEGDPSAQPAPSHSTGALRGGRRPALCDLYYTAIKKNAIFPFVTTWINIEGILLCAISWTKINIE